MTRDQVKAGVKVKILDFRGGIKTTKGTGTIVGFEPMKDYRGEVYQGERIMIKIDEGTYFNPCLHNGIGCWFLRELEETK